MLALRCRQELLVVLCFASRISCPGNQRMSLCLQVVVTPAYLAAADVLEKGGAFLFLTNHGFIDAIDVRLPPYTPPDCVRPYPCLLHVPLLSSKALGK